MTFDRHLLAAFQAVADHGTVGRAAGALNATQPTVSRHIRALEEQFGHPLFERDSRGMHLTEAGSELLPRVRLLLYEMAAAQDLIDAHRGLKRGSIRIGGVAAIARAVLPPVLALVAEREPGLRIEVVVVPSEDQLDRALANREIDIMFAVEPPREVEAVRIGTREFGDRCVVFCASTHPLLEEKQARLDAVLGQQWAMPGAEATPRRQFEGLVQAAGHPPPPVVMETDSVELILSVVSRSRILSWFPEPLLTEALERGDITVLPMPALEMRRTFSLYRRARGTFPASAQIFLDALAEAGGGAGGIRA